jgi:peptidoglycan/xylan/chitin deacetylase (PgdA/CDA1 family)
MATQSKQAWRWNLPVWILLLGLLLPGAALGATGPPGAEEHARTGAIGSIGAGGGTGPSDGMPIGCTSSPGRTVSGGSGSGRKVALTFDDGPKRVQTTAILETLERLHAVATFFEEGRHVSGHKALMREILAAGNEIGNHSYDHPKYPDRRELSSTNRLIHAATGFEPCLFRPPYGLIDGAVEAAAAQNRLETVLWSIDPGDDRHLDARAIQAHAVHRARPGSIIVMHDGGHHPQTAKALPGIIRGLQARHLRLVTVTDLLGGHFRYR